MVYIENLEDEELKKLFCDIFNEIVVLEKQEYDKLCANVFFVDSEEIRKINKENRDIDKATDVLSFPLIEDARNNLVNPKNNPFDVDYETGEISLGDVFICTEIAKSQAEEYGHSEKREYCYLFTHAMFHLFGYDHIKDDDKTEMREREELILNKFKVVR